MSKSRLFWAGQDREDPWPYALADGTTKTAILEATGHAKQPQKQYSF